VKGHATASDPWATAWLKRATAGLGPYQLVENEPGVEVVLEATKNGWRPEPFFDRTDLKCVPNESDRLLLLERKAIDFVTGRTGLSPCTVEAYRSLRTFFYVESQFGITAGERVAE
jgi:peptide/nickel transport system substrate-binding protein